MTLATVEPDGRPSARMIICRGFDPVAGWLVFYTDRESAKGRALARSTPWASCVFHWDAFERQVRVEGPVTLAPDADSDAYWNSRPPDARIAASASAQSQPLAARADLLARIADAHEERRRPDPAPAALGRLSRVGGARGAVGRTARACARPRALDATLTAGRRIQGRRVVGHAFQP